MYGLRVVGLSSLTARLWSAFAATARSAARQPWQLAAGLVAGATICAVVGIVIDLSGSGGKA
jgi:F0F1-type ATP synthase assembly protein I